MSGFVLSGQIVDVVSGRIYDGKVSIEEGKIRRISPEPVENKNFILPGLVDAHIHIESSMLTPQHFARVAVKQGTVATVSDPHEIANVLGVEGVRYMIENAEGSPLKFYFGAPSCVPATAFETSGARITSEDIRVMLQRDEVKFLSEVMNFPGVINRDPEIMEKIHNAKKAGKKIDGHAPGIRGVDLIKYVSAGIDTDHECFSYEEAVEKISHGMIIQIREGSAAKNFSALKNIIDEYPDKVMLCSDDLHPDDLINGHLNVLLKKGVEEGLSPMNLIRAVSLNPVKHYGLKVGLLQEGDPADLIIVNDLKEFKVNATYIDGIPVFQQDEALLNVQPQKSINRYFINQINPKDLQIPAGNARIKVIQAMNGELITHKCIMNVPVEKGFLSSDTGLDVLKIVVLNRYEKHNPASGFVNGFGLKSGGIISTIAHDSHNIIVVGTEDQYIVDLIGWINKNQGGIAVHDGEDIYGLPLPVAGIMSDQNAEYTASKYAQLDEKVKNLGSRLSAPFMTLSFMALLVIPELKISDKGLFDVNVFKLTSIFENE